MEILRKHSGFIALCIVLSFGFYNLGVKNAYKSPQVPTSELIGQTEGKPSNIDFAPFWRAWNFINEKYVAASTTKKQVTDQEKVYGAISGLTNSLGDPYTVFFPPVESEMFAADVRGNFEGVGMEVLAKDGVINVVSPLKNSPAERAGMRAGDKVIKINDKVTSGMATEDAVKLIRGPKGTKVTLTVSRTGVKEPLEISIIRDTIDLPVINTETLPGGIFKISLYSFTATSPNLFRGALREFVSSNNDKLLIDLRGNPGGYLEAAIDIASWFLPANKVVVRESFSKSDERVYRSRGYNIFSDKLKVVILVDKGSASASEILAGALKEHGIAKLVGERTFGKGSVQELINLTEDTTLKITVARWLTPNGNSISDTGVSPDYAVSLTQEDRSKGVDPQLQKALEILNQ